MWSIGKSYHHNSCFHTAQAAVECCGFTKKIGRRITHMPVNIIMHLNKAVVIQLGFPEREHHWLRNYKQKWQWKNRNQKSSWQIEVQVEMKLWHLMIMFIKVKPRESWRRVYPAAEYFSLCKSSQTISGLLITQCKYNDSQNINITVVKYFKPLLALCMRAMRCSFICRRSVSLPGCESDR